MFQGFCLVNCLMVILFSCCHYYYSHFYHHSSVANISTCSTPRLFNPLYSQITNPPESLQKAMKSTTFSSENE